MAEDHAAMPGSKKTGLSKVVIATVVLVGLIGLVEAVAFVVHLNGMGLETKVDILVSGPSGNKTVPLKGGYMSSLVLCGPGFIILCWYIGRNLLRGAQQIRMITIAFSAIFFSYRALLVGMLLNKHLTLPAWLDTWIILETVEIGLFVPLLILACMLQINRRSESEAILQ